MQGSEFSFKTDKKRREGKGRGGEGKERGKQGREDKEKEKGSAIVCAPARKRHNTLHSNESPRGIRSLKLRLASRLSEPPREKQNSPPYRFPKILNTDSWI